MIPRPTMRPTMRPTIDPRSTHDRTSWVNPPYYVRGNTTHTIATNRPTIDPRSRHVSQGHDRRGWGSASSLRARSPTDAPPFSSRHEPRTHDHRKQRSHHHG